MAAARTACFQHITRWLPQRDKQDKVVAAWCRACTGADACASFNWRAGQQGPDTYPAQNWN
jgi:hypothetical protein